MSIQVFFEGRLVADAEFHAVGSDGAGFLKFRIASRRGYTNKNTSEYDSDYFNVQKWLKRSGKLINHLTKGKQVVVSGTLENDNYEKDGEKKYRDVIKAREITPIFASKGDSAASEVSSDSGAAAAGDDIPF